MSDNPSKNRWGLAVAILMIGGVVAGGLYILRASREEEPVTEAEGQVAGEQFKGVIDEPVEGDAGAAVQVVLYTDLECDFCQYFHQAVWRPFREQYIKSGQARAVVRLFPIGQLYGEKNDWSERAYCVYEQGMFGALLDAMFAGGEETDLTKLTESLADADQLDECMARGGGRERVGLASRAAVEAGVTSVPAVRVGTELYEDIHTFDQLREVVDARLKHYE